MDKEKIQKFQNLTFKDFSKLAKDPSLTKYEKIGFPNSYREGYEEQIFRNIIDQNPILQEKGKAVLDIGPGCSDLITYIIQYCEEMEHSLTLIDSEEMLNLLPDNSFIKKMPGYFPRDFTKWLDSFKEKFDCIISYSVLHYVYVESSIYSFLDAALSLLKPGGTLFIGDIPNESKRYRFFSTEAGIAYHQAFTKTNTFPPPFEFRIHENKIDDGVIMGIIQRYRNFGFESYILPQPDSLPMANRREDILIKKF